MFKNNNEILQKAWENFRDLLIQDKNKPLDVFVETEADYGGDIKRFIIEEGCYIQKINVLENEIVLDTIDKPTEEQTCISLVGKEIDEYIKLLVMAKVLSNPE